MSDTFAVCRGSLLKRSVLLIFTVLGSSALFSQGSDAFSTSAPNILFNPTSGNLTTATKESDCTYGANLFEGGVAGFTSNFLYHCQFTNTGCSSGTTAVVNKTDYADLWYKVVLPSGTTQMTLIATGLGAGQVLTFSLYTSNPGTSNSTNVVTTAIIQATPTNSTPSYGGSFLSSTKTSQTILGLTAGGTYYIRVMGAVASSSSSAAVCSSVPRPSFTIEAQAPQANDACTNAINITTNNGGAAHTGNYMAAASEGADEWTDCSLASKTSAKDLWYRFNYPTASSGTVFLSELTISGTPGQIVRVFVYDVTHGCGSNPASSAVDYCEEITLSASGYTTSFNSLQSSQGQTRRVQIIPVGTVGNVTVSGKVVAANNSCEWFENVLPGFSISSAQTVNFNYGSPSAALPSQPGTDLWYTFNPNSRTDNGLLVHSTSAAVNVSGLSAGQSIRVMIYRGTGVSANNCSDLANNYISSLDFTANGSATFSCLDEIHGSTDGGYLVRIVQTGGSVASTTVTITPSAQVGKYNNSCVNIWSGSGPRNLGVSDAAHGYNAFYILSGETKNGDFTGSTDCDQGITSSSCSGVSNNPASPSNQRDLWYIFRVPTSLCPSLSNSTVINDMNLFYTANNSARDARLYVYSSCGDAGMIACSPELDGAGTTWTVNGLNQGEYYLLRIKPSSLNITFDYPFSLTINNGLMRPCNNDGAGAENLTMEACNNYNSLPVYSMKGANPSPSAGVPENDVWFTITAPNPANGGSYFNANKSWMTIFLENVSGTSTGPLYIQLYSDPNNIVATANTFSTGTSAGSKAFAHFGHLDPGQQYYLRIYHKEGPTSEVNYKLNAYTPNVNETAWTCGNNNSSLLSGCSEGCNDLREAWFKIDLPVGTPSNKYFMIEVVGQDQILDFELRSQHLSEASANEGNYDDYDHPCGSRSLEPGVTMVSEVYGITTPVTGGNCNSNGNPADGGSGVRRVYYGMNGPAAGMKDYYYIRVFMNPSDPNYATTTGLRICSINFNGPYSSEALASAGGPANEACAMTPLGVELTGFEGMRSDDANILLWETSSEMNNSHFEVQYSSDGSTFQSIGTIAGQGTSAERHAYSFEHRIGNEVSYYRLNQVDLDGTETMSKIISINSELNAVQVFPNPIKADVGLSIRSEEMITSVEVYTAFGQLHHQVMDINNKNYLLQPIRESGVYIVKITCADRQYFHRILSH